MSLLTIENLEVFYGVINAIKGISFEVNEGEIIALIGANGAGKTTILNTITGLVPAKSGSIKFEDKDLLKTPAHKIVSMGIAHVPEGRRIFQQLTVFENLKLGAYTRKDKKEIADTLELVYERFPRLKERRTQIAGTLSGGEQQMLAISRGLMSSPKLLMLDEPSLGLAPIIVEDIFKTILHIREMKKIPIVLVEQNAFMALDASDRAYVLELGTMRMEGRAKELMESPEIKKAYLGG